MDLDAQNDRIEFGRRQFWLPGMTRPVTSLARPPGSEHPCRLVLQLGPPASPCYSVDTLTRDRPGQLNNQLPVRLSPGRRVSTVGERQTGAG